MAERARIRNIQYARQRADFNGMRFGSISPTDIDGFVEFGNEVFIFMEAKHGGADLPIGQRLALERLCDRVQAGGADAVVLILHNWKIGSDAPTYLLADLPVAEIRHMGEWRSPKKPICAREAIELFASKKLGREISAKSSAPPIAADDDWLREFEQTPVGPKAK